MHSLKGHRLGVLSIRAFNDGKGAAAAKRLRRSDSQHVAMARLRFAYRMHTPCFVFERPHMDTSDSTRC